MSSPASHSLLAPRSSKLSRFVAFSVGLHVAVVVVGVVLAGIDTKPKIELDQKPIKATLIRRGKPRDEKLLPRKETPPPPPKEVKAPPQPTPTAPTPPPPTQPAAVVPVASAKPAPAPTPQVGEKSGVDRKKDLFSAFDRTAKQAEEPEELEGAEDGDPDGDSATQEGERYYGMLSAQIKRNYSLPDTLSEQERLYLKALVRIRIGNAGQLLDASLVKGSENSQFDNAVLAAVKRAAPFSPPPEHLRAMLGNRGVPMEFNP